jgi:hypothetical protein
MVRPAATWFLRPGCALAVLLALGVCGPVHAQTRRGGKTAPPASSLGSGREDPPPPPRPVATEADLAVLRAIGFLFEPAPREIRVIAVGDVALLGDPRGLDPLAHMILDPDPVVAQAAIEAVGRFRHPRAEQILSNVVRHDGLPVALKLAAVRALPFQDTPSSRELLSELSVSDRQAPPIRKTATDMIRLLGAGSPPPREERSK